MMLIGPAAILGRSGQTVDGVGLINSVITEQSDHTVEHEISHIER